jgi:hypothetical protein
MKGIREMQLSRNFPYKEMIYSATANAKGIDNTPGTIEHKNLFLLCQFSLQKIRDRYGRVDITSGYRCLELNREVRSKDTSEHVSGCAADFRVPGADLKEVFEWIKINLVFGQAIYEAPPGVEPWIHISLPRMGKKNQQPLSWDGANYKPA